jgi:hypothetical protein
MQIPVEQRVQGRNSIYDICCRLGREAEEHRASNAFPPGHALSESKLGYFKKLADGYEASLFEKSAGDPAKYNSLVDQYIRALRARAAASAAARRQGVSGDAPGVAAAAPPVAAAAPPAVAMAQRVVISEEMRAEMMAFRLELMQSGVIERLQVIKLYNQINSASVEKAQRLDRHCAELVRFYEKLGIGLVDAREHLRRIEEYEAEILAAFGEISATDLRAQPDLPCTILLRVATREKTAPILERAQKRAKALLQEGRLAGLELV